MDKLQRYECRCPVWVKSDDGVCKSEDVAALEAENERLRAEVAELESWKSKALDVMHRLAGGVWRLKRHNCLNDHDESQYRHWIDVTSDASEEAQEMYLKACAS